MPIVIRNVDPQKISLEQSFTISVGGVEDYDGSYDITPLVTAQVMETENKRMTEDVSVRAIPIYEVSNVQGGKTVYIGANLED